MPKSRYGIMTPYMEKVGSLGTSMMYRSCTVQANLDFSDEADMVKKMRVSLALQPVVTALFANSPFVDGKPSGYLSFRSHIWLDTDKARTGMLPFVFDDGFGFDRYAEHALDVPMYFVIRNKQYVNVAGESFRAFMQGRTAAASRRKADRQGLGGSPLDAVPRSPPQAVPRNARRRHGRSRPCPGATGALGRPAL